MYIPALRHMGWGVEPCGVMELAAEAESVEGVCNGAADARDVSPSSVSKISSPAVVVLGKRTFVVVEATAVGLRRM
jgi:hypothetical protein